MCWQAARTRANWGAVSARGEKGKVELVGIGGGEAGGPLGAATSDDERRVGLLRGFGQGGAVVELVEATVEVEGLALPAFSQRPVRMEN